MTPKLWKWVIIAVVVVGSLIVAARFIDAHRNDKTKADLDTAKAAQVAHAQQQPLQAHIDTVVDTLWLKEKSHTANAGSANAASDTAGQHAVSLRDTANMWHLRWQLRGVAYAQLDTAKRAADARADALTLGRDSARTDADRLAHVNETLQHDLEHLNDCHILPFVPCPSRKVALIGGLALGAVAMSNPKATVDAAGSLLKKIITLGR